MSFMQAVDHFLVQCEIHSRPQTSSCTCNAINLIIPPICYPTFATINASFVSAPLRKQAPDMHRIVAFQFVQLVSDPPSKMHLTSTIPSIVKSNHTTTLPPIWAPTSLLILHRTSHKHPASASTPPAILLRLPHSRFCAA